MSLANGDQEKTLSARRWSIGRAPDCDHVISHAQVSSYHAFLEEGPLGKFQIRDNQSTNGTYLNDPDNRVEQSAPVMDDDLVYFSRQYRMTAGEIRRALGSKARGEERLPGQILQIDRPLITIGRDAQNTLVLKSLFASRFHARIERLPDGKIRVQDLGSTHGTSINGELIRGQSRIISLNDKVEITGMMLSLQVSGDHFTLVGVERPGISIVTYTLGFLTSPSGDWMSRIAGMTRRLNRAVAPLFGWRTPPRGEEGPRQLLRDIDLLISPGEFVGLMGPSGCGKTTLLKVLLGSERMTAGSVQYNGMDVSVFKERYGSLLGYVPQEDLLHAELTVHETLRYQAKLRLPDDVSEREIDDKIKLLCEQLSLHDSRNVRVGSPERRGLSGGQRKRLSLAVELLADPKILYLDEPTSGLSSSDTWKVMQLLQQLAFQRGITVVITIHQPAQRVYELLNKVIYLKKGELLYFGPACPDSISYFFPKKPPGAAGPDEVMEKLDEADQTELAREFRAHQPYRENVLEQRARSSGEPHGTSAGLRPKAVPFGRQFWYLLCRYLRCRWEDHTSLLVLLGQGPLVAVLMSQIFKGQTPQEVLTVLFLLGLVSLWFGVNNSAREIVGELALLQREKRVDVNTTAYLFSKIVGQGAISLVQVCLLLAITLGMLDQVPLSFGPALGACWAVSLVGISIGLAISATVKTQISAVEAVPLIMIPVILLGGLIKPFPEMKGFIRLVADLTPVRWSFDLLSALCRDLPHDMFEGAEWPGAALYLAIAFGLMVYYGAWRLKKL